jgi:hypothetical protein
LAWVYDAFNELPYLRFRGDFGTGKTRALTALGSLCYKPFFASGASTVSPIFHVLEAFRGTLVLDEADVRFSDATASLTKILNNGNVQGMPVLRTMSNAQRELNPKAYRVFGPKLIGMRGRFTDLALESRFLTHETSGRALRADIPIQLPPAMRGEARALRNKLLVWRLRHRRQIGLEVAPPAAGLGPRTLQIALPLLSLMDDPGLRELFVGMLGDHEGALGRARGYAPDAHLLESVLECFDVEAGAGASVADITARFNTRATPYLGRAMTPRWVGGALRAHFGLATVKSHGVYVIPAETRPRVLELVRDRRDAAGTLSVIPDADDHSE